MDPEDSVFTFPNEITPEELNPNPMSIKSLFRLLNREVPTREWQRIHNHFTIDRLDNAGFEVTISVLFQAGKIKKDLNELHQIMKRFGREEILKPIEQFGRQFSKMSEQEFKRQFSEELTKEFKLLVN